MQYNKQEPASIKQMFGTIAKSYDRTNGILSFQLHRYWNKKLVEKTFKNPHEILDLCCGSGEIALTYLKKRKDPCTVHLLDFCKEMLACAKEKISQCPTFPNNTYYYHEADAQQIPLKEKSVDAATMAYGIRNVKETKKCLADVYRVLRPGGCFGILELTRPKNPLLKVGHQLYLKTLLPLIGRIFSSNEEAYRYLCESIHNFIDPEELKKQLESVGFQEVLITPLSGGIATILFAKKK